MVCGILYGCEEEWQAVFCMDVKEDLYDRQVNRIEDICNTNI